MRQLVIVDLDRFIGSNGKWIPSSRLPYQDTYIADVFRWIEKSRSSSADPRSRAVQSATNSLSEQRSKSIDRDVLEYIAVCALSIGGFFALLANDFGFTGSTAYLVMVFFAYIGFLSLRERSQHRNLLSQVPPPIAATRSYSGRISDEILLLRSFSADKMTVRMDTIETCVARCLSALGHIVTVHDPRANANMAPIGAQRIAVDDDRWQEYVRSRLIQSPLVAVVCGKTPGLLWEVDRISDLNALEKTIFVFPSPQDPKPLNLAPSPSGPDFFLSILIAVVMGLIKGGIKTFKSARYEAKQLDIWSNISRRLEIESRFEQWPSPIAMAFPDKGTCLLIKSSLGHEEIHQTAVAIAAHAIHKSQQAEGNISLARQSEEPSPSDIHEASLHIDILWRTPWGWMARLKGGDAISLMDGACSYWPLIEEFHRANPACADGWELSSDVNEKGEFVGRSYSILSRLATMARFTW